MGVQRVLCLALALISLTAVASAYRPVSGEKPSTTETPAPPPPNEEVDSGLADSILPAKSICGLEEFEDKIHGGNETGLAQYPWMGLVEYRTKKGTLSLACGATLISKRYVLTAGHCVVGAVLKEVGTPVSVRLGEFDKRTGKDCLPLFGGREECNEDPVSIPIELITTHPDYTPGRKGENKNDIAIIRLASDAPYSSFIRPICLPSSDITQRKTSEPIELLVAGWGSTETSSKSDVKLHLLVPLVDHTVCQNAYSSGPLKIGLWDKQLCAGAERGKDACRGDSGGPLMAQEDSDNYELHGVVSFGPKPCALNGVPGVYTKVFAYIPWIRSVLKE